MAIAPVLQRFVDDELGRAPDLVERTLAGTLQLLRDTKDSPLVASEREHHLALVEALHSHGTSYQRAFTEALQAGVQEALAEQQEGQLADPQGADGGLELMDESRVEIDIEISRAMQLIDTTAEWELRELQTFTSTLIGQSHVSAESNPLRPLVYATALWKAACAASPVPVHRTTLLRVSAGVTAGLLKSAWAAACTRLEAQGVEPSVYRTVLLTPGSTIGREPASANASKPGVMASLLASMPGGSARLQVGVGKSAGSMGVDASSSDAPASAGNNPEFEQALARLEELLRHLPRSSKPGSDSGESVVKRLKLHRAALIASASAPIERQIIELLSRVFDTILTDPQVPAACAAALARLQASTLRVALHDRDMLVTTHHPVWKLFDRIAEASTGYPQANDPRAAALSNVCHALAEQLARVPNPDAALFRRALAQLDAFLADQLAQQLRASQSAVQTLQLAERRETLQRALTLRLVDQMVPVRTSPGIRRFMTSTWAAVLAESMLRFGEQDEVTRGYIKLVDELLWSVQLPDHPQSRQRLLTLLPTMLQRLRAGMALISMPAGDQAVVLDELMAIHAEGLRPGGRGDATALTPEQIVQRMRDEVLPASTGHGGFTDSVIDLASMETVPADMMPTTTTGAEPLRRIDALQPGERLRVFLRGRWTRTQLLWRSDQGMFLLLAGETATRPHSVTQRALERLNSAGLVLPHETKPLVQRALDVVARELTRPA